MFIVEIQTTTGPVCESFETYEEARRRIELFPAEALLGTPVYLDLHVKVAKDVIESPTEAGLAALSPDKDLKNGFFNTEGSKGNF